MSARASPLHIDFSAGRGVNSRALPHAVLRPSGTDVSILEYAVSGRGFVRGRSGTFFTEPGDFLLFEPGVAQDYGMDVDVGRWDHIWFCFTARAAWYDLLDWPEPSPGILRLHVASRDLRRRLQARLESALAIANGPLARREEFVMNALEEVLLWCDTVNPRSEHARLDGRIRAALEHVCERYAEPLTVEGLAKIACLSPSRFSHLFRAQVGATPMQYLERQRIAHARSLLVMSASPVSRIAYEVGFASPFYFTRVFGRSVGMSPRAFRRAGAARRAP